MASLILSYDPSARPLGTYGVRMGVYSLVNLGLFLLPSPWTYLSFPTIFFLGVYSRLNWVDWVYSLKGFWIFILLGPLVGFPWEMVFPLEQNFSFTQFWLQWGPAWQKAGVFLGIFASSHWLTATTTILEIRRGLEALLSILGKRVSETLGLVGALALAYLPWTGEQVRKVNEAMDLRGQNSKKHPLGRIKGLGLPVTLRLLEKSRHTAEALSLRNS